jgi:tyrosyl-tRNA synthetase
MQGYDAYALGCDVQVGGTEQLFNLMAGRKIQEDAGQRPHVPVTMPILVGVDGKQRMSKSTGNHIGIGDPPDEQYGKAMSIPDEVVMDFFVLGTSVPRSELDDIRRQLERDPMGTKKLLARTIVTEFHGPEAADEAEATFERTVQRREVPDDIPEAPVNGGGPLLELLVEHGLAPSRREARRLFEQGAVSVDGEVVAPDVVARAGGVVQVGKRRWLRLV